MTIQDLFRKIQDREMVLLDGALGTELERREYRLDPLVWSALATEECPELVRRIHGEYVAAGADIITANTFRTHAENLKSLGRQADACSLTKEAVALARDAAEDRALVAGSLAPVGDCYQPNTIHTEEELRAIHSRQAEHLARAGVDLLLLETHSTLRELLQAVKAAKATELPFCVSLYSPDESRLLSGEELARVIPPLLEFEPNGVLFNCMTAESVSRILDQFRDFIEQESSIAWGGYANTGVLDHTRNEWTNGKAARPRDYATEAEQWRQRGATMIGGCCGTTPEHIRQLFRRLSPP